MQVSSRPGKSFQGHANERCEVESERNYPASICEDTADQQHDVRMHELKNVFV